MVTLMYVDGDTVRVNYKNCNCYYFSIIRHNKNVHPFEGLLAIVLSPGGGGALPYMSYTCRGIGYDFWRFSILK